MFVDDHRIEPTQEGDFRLRLPQEERELLRRLPAALRDLLAVAPADPDLCRLFPPAYEDDADEAEYRRQMQADLVEGRRETLRVLEESVDNVRLSPDEAQAWLSALNDLRLVLGTRLDVARRHFSLGSTGASPVHASSRSTPICPACRRSWWRRSAADRPGRADEALGPGSVLRW